MSFDQIYQEYFRDVFYYLRSLTADRDTAEDLTQETFTKALQSIEHYDGRKDIRAWLFTIAKNAFIDRCRKQKHYGAETIWDTAADSKSDFIDKIMDHDSAFQIHKFLHKMPEPYKEVFTLRIFGELSFEQIASLFGKSAGWARVTFYRAKQKILSYWEGMEYE